MKDEEWRREHGGLSPLAELIVLSTIYASVALAAIYAVWWLLK